MTSIPGFENLEKIKRDYQWFDLNTHKYGPLKKGQKYCGGVPLLYDAESQRIYVDSTDTHSLVFGATGSLKTRSIVMPTIKMLSYAGESMIINDAKGELYDRLANDLVKQGYEIVVINLREPITGNCWNPLYLPYQFYLNGDIDRACEFINDIANNLTVEESSNQDPFWNNSAADLIFGLVLLLFKYCKEHNEDISAVNISNILALRRKLFENTQNRLKGPKDTAIWQYASSDELIAASLSGTVFSPSDTMNSILSVFDNIMRIFSQQPTLTQMLANNDFDIADIGRKRMALFIVIQDEKTNYHKLCSLFIKQSYEYLIFTAMSSGRKKLENRVFYCLDEFSALPSVADFPAMITAARSRDIRFLLVVQSQSSLKRRYKEEAETIVSNCSNWIFFTSRELSLLRELSELCGMQKNNHTPNISTYELQHFSKEKREALLLCGRYRPAKVTMIDIDNPLLSGKSYDILRIPVTERQKRTILDFEVKEPEEVSTEIFDSDHILRDISALSAWNNSPHETGIITPTQDTNTVFEAAVADVEKRMVELTPKNTEFVQNTLDEEDQEPGSLEELLRQLRSED